MTEEHLFELARQASPDERPALLDRECGGNPELRGRVEALLAADAQSHQTIDSPIYQTASIAATNGEVGAVIAGKYKLVELIGEGGMGSVWLAEQSEPIRRRVALKLIKAGMDSKQVIARFEAERQALAVMDHPNIAKVLDGGLHDNRPYFVMELVKGVPITQYCDAKKLTPRERLELFVPVCQAIQHAHQKGIIHRDIKPSNVLIAPSDDRPAPKVIDFGVAKATGGTLTEATLDTAFGGVVGTPQYMSPEQASLNNLDIDTRSDIYSLGVLLYELLTGSPPFSGEELKKKGVLEVLRVVREEDPPRPSTKLSTADALPNISAQRGTEPKKLTGLLRNELDWIVMKALDKDRIRRYETANGFAADVLRFLAGEPVQAHPPSTAYRVKKYVRRNRPQVIAASLLLLALVAGVMGTTIGMLEARRQAEIAQREAEAKEAARAEEENQRAIAEANEKKAIAAAEQERLAKAQIALQVKQIERVNDSVFDIFSGFDIREMKAGSEPLEAVLAKKLIETGRRLDEKAISDPLVLAKIRNRLGVTLINLGYTLEAVKLFVDARATRAEKLGNDNPLTLISMSNLALGYHTAGKLDQAIPLFEETLQLMTAKLGPDHQDTLACMNNLAEGYRAAGKLDKALPLFEETVRIQRVKHGSDHLKTLRSMNNLAEGYREAGKLDKALPLYEEAFRLIKAKLGPDHPDTLTSMSNLAMGYHAGRKLDQALPMFEEVLRLTRAKLGAEHPSTMGSMNNLAAGYRDAGKLDQALPLFEEVFRLTKAKLGPDHPHTLRSMNNLAAVFQDAGKLDQALPLYEETLHLMKIKLGSEHPTTLDSMNNLALGYRAAGKLDQALPLFEEALRLQKATLGPDHPNTRRSMNNLAASYQAAGKFDLVPPLIEESLELTKAKLGPEHPDTLVSLGALGAAYCDAGQGEKASATLTTFVSGKRKHYPKHSPQFAGLLAQVSVDLFKCGQFAAAEELLRESLAIREKTQPDAWSTFNTQSLLGGALLGQKKYADAEPLLLKGYEGMKAREAQMPKDSTRIPEALDRLIQLYLETDKPDQAKKYQVLRASYLAGK